MSTPTWDSTLPTWEGTSPEQQSSQPEPSMLQQAGNYLQDKAVDFATDVAGPQRVGEYIGKDLPAKGAVIGGALLPGAGVPLGAGTGQIAKRMIGIATGAQRPAGTPLQEAVGPMIQAGASGLLETGEAQAGLAKVGKSLAKAGQTISGAKADVLEQATRQGYSTYAAPSLPKAQEVFAEALGSEGRAAMKTTAEQAFDPALGQARKLATDIGSKIEAGETVNAIDALKARQATDRVISATPFWDRKTRAALFDWRSQFDKVMTGQSESLANASSTYRKAVVKDQLLNLTRINKHGEPSALLPMLAGIAGPVAGYGSGHTGKGSLAAAAYLGATSPLAAGAVATTIGMVNPAFRQAVLSEFVDRLVSRDQSGEVRRIGEHQ